MSVDYLPQVRSELKALREALPFLDAVLKTPASFPHSSGLYLESRIAHTLATADAIGAKGAVYRALLLFSHLSKPECVMFSASAGSRGEKEGFVQHKYRAQACATPAEIRHYVNLAQVFAAPPNGVDMEAFFQAYGIEVSYGDAAHRLRGPEYRKQLEQLCETLGVDARYVEVIRHIAVHLGEVMDGLLKGDVTAYHTAVGVECDPLERAELWMNTLWTLGGKQYKERYLALEHLVHPELAHARAELKALERSRKIKAILRDAGLLEEDIFELCGAGFGPERGELMEQIKKSVQEGADVERLAPIQDRIARARSVLN